MNIEKALRLPFANGFVKVIIGAVLSLIPIVNFLVSGYYIEVMSNAIKGKEEMPAWENWGNIFIKGLVVFAICLIYMLIPILIFMISGGIGSIFDSGFSFGIVLGLLAALAIWFILPMALAHYAAAGQFGASFNFGSIFSSIGAAPGNYLGIYLLSIILFIVMGIFAMIPVIGWMVCILGGFYIGCVLSFLFGEAYRKVNRDKKPEIGIQG